MSFKSAKDFVGDDDVVLIFGDNIFIGDLTQIVEESLYNLKNFSKLKRMVKTNKTLL